MTSQQYFPTADMSPGDMRNGQLHQELDRLTEIAQARYNEGLPITMINARCTSLLDEMERRGMLDTQRIPKIETHTCSCGDTHAVRFPEPAELPHSRACGIRPHVHHVEECAKDCPTCYA
jgi:hypothetical protein